VIIEIIQLHSTIHQELKSQIVALYDVIIRNFHFSESSLINCKITDEILLNIPLYNDKNELHYLFIF